MLPHKFNIGMTALFKVGIASFIMQLVMALLAIPLAFAKHIAPGWHGVAVAVGVLYVVGIIVWILPNVAIFSCKFCGIRINVPDDEIGL